MNYYLHFCLVVLIASMISGCGTNALIATPPATLEAHLAMETIKRLLQNSEDCEAPCFLGISPGETTFNEATNIFNHLGLELEHTNSQDTKTFYSLSYDFDNGLGITPVLTVEEDLVKNIMVGINPDKYFPEAPRNWSAYSLDTLINRYGPPSSVEFFVEGPTYIIDVYFKSRGLIVEYYSNDLRPGFEICPLTSDFSSVGLWFGSDPQYPPRPGVPLELATSLTTEEFSELMTGDPSQACINLNKEAFQ